MFALSSLDLFFSKKIWKNRNIINHSRTHWNINEASIFRFSYFIINRFTGKYNLLIFQKGNYNKELILSFLRN